MTSCDLCCGKEEKSGRCIGFAIFEAGIRITLPVGPVEVVLKGHYPKSRALLLADARKICPIAAGRIGQLKFKTFPPKQMQRELFEGDTQKPDDPGPGRKKKRNRVCA
jgi:hypothetical protein